MKKQILTLSLIALLILITIFTIIISTSKDLSASPIKYCRCHTLTGNCMEGNMFSLRPRCGAPCTITHPCDNID